jgi:ElaB/YqjD/DUF883 family membrane-anchored ribosome-binding protein
MTRNPGQSELNEDAASIDEATGDMREGAMSLTARGSAIASDAMDEWRETVHHVRTAGHEYTERAYEVGKRKAEEAAFYTELGYEEAIDLVRQRPIAALSIAAGVGFLLGLVTARR